MSSRRLKRTSGAISLGVEGLIEHGTDLDTTDPDVAATLQAVDLVEPGDQLVAAVLFDLAGIIGEQKKPDRNDKNDRAEQRLEEISARGQSTGNLPSGALRS